MTRQWRPRTRGPGSAIGPSAPDARQWWAKTRTWPIESAGHARMAAASADQSHSAEREAVKLAALAADATAVQQATDEHSLFEAVGAAIERHGLSGHLTTPDPTRAFLEIRRIMLPWAHQVQLERIHAGPMLGARIELSPDTAHWAVVHDGSSMQAPAPLAWVLGAALEIGPVEVDAIGGFVGLGEALLVPVTDGREIHGVLTVWAPALTRADRAVVEILARLAGGALSAQRARDVAGTGVAPTLAA